MLDLSLAVEAENFRAAAELRSAATAPVAPRRSCCGCARRRRRPTAPASSASASALALDKAFVAIHRDEVPLGDYLRELRYLGLVPGWGTQALRLHFGEAMDKLAAIEPMADLFIQDQLRGSPLLFYSQVLDRLSRDANRLAGVQHKLLGKDIGAGFNALNPGLARGVLRAAPDMKRVDAFRADGIYVLPEIGRRPAAARRHPDRGRGQSALARAAAGAQPRHSERRRRRVACCPSCGATTAGASCWR